MQENHSFDSYFGVLGYQPNGPYHTNPGKACKSTDNACVNGLNCTRSAAGEYICANSNPENDGAFDVHSFHDKNYCPAPDLQHSWPGSHMEGNFSSPNNMLISSPNNGFVIVNDQTEQKDSIENALEDDTMGFYDVTDLPYYYALAQTFAIDDQYFCDVVGPTIPNRFYLLAATSFGHLTTNEVVPPVGGYQPITGTIFDLLDKAGVNWIDYFTDLAQGADFRDPVPPHFLPVTNFFADAAAGTLPPVAFVDPELAGTTNLATDEHPPHDIRAGEFFVAQVINAVRNSPNWKDSIIFLTYDEHGGFFDHMKPPKANQNGALTPDGIAPGQCADLSNPPTSTEPGMGANCSSNPIGTSSQQDAATLCPAFTPNGPYPAACANFNQLGFRVPFVAISPFSRQHYVSHTIGNHGSILNLIEKRFLGGKFLTRRDEFSNDLEDLFDFTDSPSLTASVSPSLAPAPNLVTDGNGSCTIQGTGLPEP
jgi:phospholipase C